MPEPPTTVKDVRSHLLEHEQRLQSYLENWMQQNTDMMMRMYTMIETRMPSLGATVAPPTLRTEWSATSPPELDVEASIEQDCEENVQRETPHDDNMKSPTTPKHARFEEQASSSLNEPAHVVTDNQMIRVSSHNTAEEFAAQPLCHPGASRQTLMEQAGKLQNQSLQKTATGKAILRQVREHGLRRMSLGAVLHGLSFRTRFKGELSYFMHGWEHLINFLSIANAFFLGLLAEANAIHEDRITRPIDWVFAVTFLLDILLRVFVQDDEFFVGPHRVLHLIEFGGLISYFLDLLVVDHVSPVAQIAMLRITRVFKLLRVLRVVQTFKMFRELRLIVGSLVNMGRIFFGIGFVLIFTTYVAGFGLVHPCAKAETDAEAEATCKYFGSVSSSMFTLYQVILGGLPWGQVVETLSPVDHVGKIMFVAYVSFCVLVILNVPPAMLVDCVKRCMKADTEALINEEIRRKETIIEYMRKHFNDIDANQSGAISFDELQIAIGDARMEAFMSSALGVEVYDLKRLFELLDTDGTGAIDMEEFLLGCLCLKGYARATDMVSLQRDVTVLTSYVMEIKAHHGLKSKSRDRTETSVTKYAPRRLSTVDMHAPRNACCIIEKPEERAMLLSELRQVWSTINERCKAESWTDRRKGKSLEPQDVDLYQFTYHVTCPETVPDGIILRGLPPALYSEGETITQASTYVCAEGTITEQTGNGTVKVKVSFGRFIAYEPGREREISVSNMKFGVPESVEAPSAISYKELISNAPQKPRWYCSHWWGESIYCFLLCCEEHAARREMKPDEASYWVCGYAIRQYSVNEDICIDIKSTAFFKAITASQGVLVVLDSNATPFTRIWCDFEIYEALSGNSLESRKIMDIVAVPESGRAHMISDGLLPKEIARDKTKRESEFPLRLLVKGMQAKLEDGKATVDSDRINILKYIGGPEALQRASCTLNSFFVRAAWPQAVKKNIVRDFDDSQPGQLSLPEILARDVEIKSWVLSLEHMDEMNDLHVTALAEALPPNLLELSLSFEGCKQVSSEGLQQLAIHLPEKIQVLKLDFLGCRGIDDGGLEWLANHLPRNMKALQLHFDSCEKISMRGVKALADNVGRGVIFKGTFKGTGVDRSFDSLVELKRVKGATELKKPGSFL